MQDRMLNIREVAAKIGISRSTLYELVNDGRFPPAVRVTERVRRWPESDAANFIAEQVQARDAATTKPARRAPKA
jgi:prophage regulatory protein